MRKTTAILLCIAGLAAAVLIAQKAAHTDDDKSPAQLALESASTNNVRWGETTNGLQMGIIVEPSFGAVHCWLRNGGTNEISYSNYLLADWESVDLEIREGSNWVDLQRAPAKWRGYEGIGPSIGKICKLQPHEVIAPPMSAQSHSSRGATFLVDLLNFDWPDKVAHSGACEMRICHSFAVTNRVDSSFFAVCSPVFSLDGTAVKGLLDQLPRAVTNKRE